MADTSTNTWTFSGLDRTRYKLTQQQAKEITEIYRQAHDNISKRIDEELKKSGNQRTLTVAYFDDLKKEIRREMQNVSEQLNVVIPKNMLAMSESTGKSADGFAESLGFEVSSRWSAVSTDIVTSILSGEVYQKDWSFSNALWKDLTKNTKEIDKIVAMGAAENRSALEIAKDLETFVDPKAKKASRKIVYESYYRNGVKIPKKDYLNLSEEEKAKCEVKENTYFFGKVDYNAQRLARTLISHAYQQSLVNSCKPNPFVEGFIWQASGSDRMCPICAARDGKFYKKDELPLDHPNGMCTFTAAIPDMNDVADRLADWVNGKDDPALDNYAAYLGYENIGKAKNDVDKSRNGGIIKERTTALVDGKNVVGEWERRSNFENAIDDIIDYQGYNGKPTIVYNQDKFNSAVEKDHFLAERTFCAETKEKLDEYDNQLKCLNGENYFYVNCGVGGAQYGQGMYCAADYTKGTITYDKFEHEINQYAWGDKYKYSKTNWMTLDPSAKILDVPSGSSRQECTEFIGRKYMDFYLDHRLNSNADLKEQWDEYQKGMEAVRQLNSSKKTSDWDKADELSERLDTKFPKARQLQLDVINCANDKDAGVMAAEMGYDVINAQGHGTTDSYSVVLNRTKLIIYGGDNYEYKPK